MTNIALFWSKPPSESDTLESWLSTDIELSEFHDLGLTSHIRVGQKVRLYTYQNIITDIPDGIEICSASDYYPSETAFDAMKRGHSIAHVSDIVRLKSALDHNAVVLDMDAVMINPFPDIDCFTSTLAAKTTGGMAIKFGKSHPPFIIHDGSWDGKALSVFPIKVHDCIRQPILDLIHKIEQSLSGDPKSDTKGWNYIMWTLKDIANANPSVKVMQPIHCAPIPAWHSAGKCYSLESPTRLDGKTQLFGYTLPSIDQIMSETYCVQHFFESSFKKSNPIEGFWSKIKENSLLDHEARLVYGQDWKSIKTNTNTLF